MRTDYNTERFQGFLRDLKESFWGDLQGKVRDTLKKLLEADSEQRMEEYLGLRWYERAEEREDSRNGFYERDYVTPWGVIRFRVRRTRKQSFLPRMLRVWERRSPEVAELIRQAFLRGIPTRGVGRVVALLTDEPVSAQTVSKLTRVLDRQVEAFHHAPLDDHWAYLILDGVWMKVRRAWGPQRVLLLVAYGVRPNGERQLLAFQRARGESEAAWEGFLNNLRERGLLGQHLQMIITDGCAGLAAGLPAGGEGSGPRLAGAPELLCLSPAPLEEAAHHQCHRALLRGSPPAHAPHGGLHQCRERRSNHLCDL